MKTILLVLFMITIASVSLIILKNNNMNNGSPQHKIATQKPIIILSGEIQYRAPNNMDKPSLVSAQKGDEVIWQRELVSPAINPNLEKDVQLLDYFVTAMKIDQFQSQDALYVTIGSATKSKTFILNLENGSLIN